MLHNLWFLVHVHLNFLLLQGTTYSTSGTMLLLLLWVFQQILLISSNSSDIRIFTTDTPVSKVITFNDTYIVGSQNFIYKLSKDLQVLGRVAIGPINGEDNWVTLLSVKPDEGDEPLLLWCGSVDRGSCHINRLRSNIGLSPDYLDKTYVTDKLSDRFDELDAPEEWRAILSYGVYGHLGSKTNSLSTFLEVKPSPNETDYMLLSTATTDRRMSMELPVIALYQVKRSSPSSYYIKPSVLDPASQNFSWLAMYEDISFSYPIYHIKVLETSEYVYLIAVQKRRAQVPAREMRYHTRIARFNKSDTSFQSYVEAPVKCTVGEWNYNIAVDAQIGNVGTKISQKYELSDDEQAIFLLSGRSLEYAAFPTEKTTLVCMLPLTDLNRHLDTALQRCHRGRGRLVDWYYGQPRKPCRLLVRQRFSLSLSILIRFVMVVEKSVSPKTI